MPKDYTDVMIKGAQTIKYVYLLPYAASLRWCNNNCNFCYLKPARDRKLMPLEDFISLGETQVKWLRENGDRLPEDTIVKCEIIGGEIGILPKAYFDYLFKLADDLEDAATKTNVNLIFSLITNLLLSESEFQNVVSLYNHIEESNYNVSITTSFDMAGRFQTKSLLDIWKRNTTWLIENGYKTLIETILTKSSIQTYLEEEKQEIIQTFDYFLSTDLCEKTSVIFNEYIPYNSKVTKEVPSFEELCEFYKKIIKTHGTNLNTFQVYRLDKQISSPRHPCENVFIASVLNKDNQLAGKDGILQKKPCELHTHNLWPKNDPIKVEDISKKQPTEEFICVEHPEKVEAFFANTYGCYTCRFYNECNKRNVKGCYQNHQFIWKDNKCIHKKLFEMVNDE